MIRLQLTGRQQLRTMPEERPATLQPGFRRLRVLFCGICRTDGRMWAEGHRDLRLPRVPGHEVAAIDPADGSLYTVWPGVPCTTCSSCTSGMEHLCDRIRIIGFHLDGGFADTIDVPEQALVPAPGDMAPELLAFAEPMACTLHALTQTGTGAGDRVIIYGGGVLGMLAALACRTLGAASVVVETSGEKRKKTAGFCSAAGIQSLATPPAGPFDVAINCCSGIEPFRSCLEQLKKGGRLGFFSALHKNSAFASDLVNLIHYRGLTVTGSYGPRRVDMAAAVVCCREQGEALRFLIEGIITSREAASALAQVARGEALKYILDFKQGRGTT